VNSLTHENAQNVQKWVNAFLHNNWVQVRVRKICMRFDLSPIQTPMLLLHEVMDRFILFHVAWFSQLQDLGPVKYVKKKNIMLKSIKSLYQVYILTYKKRRKIAFGKELPS